MKRGPRSPLTPALASALAPVLTAAFLLAAIFAGQVAAQPTDGLLDRYQAVVANLRSAVTLAASDPAQARDDLDRAQTSLIALAGTVENTTLVSAMERIFERTRTALDNGSVVDLAVQSQVLEGGFQRLVFESALAAARGGDLALARDRVAAVATDMELGPEAQEAIAGATSGQMLRLAFEAAVADRIGALLADVDVQLDGDIDDAYRTFGDAYGGFLLVQDSPRAPENVNPGFTAAAEAIVNGDVGAVREELAGLEQSFLALGREARAAAAVAPTGPGTAAEPAPVRTAPAGDVAPAPSGDAPTGDATDAAPAAAETPAPAAVATAPETPATAEVAPVATAPQPTPSDGADAAPPTGPTTQTPAPATPEAAAPAAPATAAPAAPDPVAIATAAIARELTASGLPAARREALAATIAEDGFTSFERVVDALLASSAELLVAVEIGDTPEQRRALDTLRDDYRRYVAPALEQRNAAFAASTERLIASLSGAPGARIQDVAVIAGHVALIPDVLAGQPVPLTHQAIVQTVPFWVGWIRVVVVLLLGLLALVPLYLLNLAFGGGNRNWQLIGVALFLLMLPVIYEGLAYLGTLLADITGVQALGMLSVFSIFQNLLSQVIWALVTGVAIALAVIGLYGICVQFGLLGRSSSPDATQTATIDQTETLVDWDEEF